MSLTQIAQLVSSAKAVFVDWDGCVVLDESFIPGADVFLRRFQDHTTILSNNSTELPHTLAAILERAGITIKPGHILLAGHQAINYTRKHHCGDRIFMMASREMCAFASEQGLTLVGHDADVVLLLRDVDFNYRKLRVAINMIRGGAQLIVANPDATHPTRNGLTPETGAIMAAITLCCDPITPVIIGKPSSTIFEHALHQQGLAPNEVVMIGDNADTDIAGAKSFGIPAVLLTPEQGVTLGSIAEAVKLNEDARFALEL